MSKRWITAIACATALLITGCGGTGKSSLQLVQSASDVVVAKKTARVEMRFDASGQSFAMNGQLDFVNPKGAFVMDPPGLGKLQLVFEGSRLYLNPAGGGWAQINLQGDVAKQVLQGFGADPRAILEQMSGAGGVEKVGTEQIRGVETTHYTGDLDIVKALQAQGMPQAEIDAFQKQTSSAGKTTAKVDVYLDADGLAHRSVSHVKVPGLLDITITMDLLDFGKPVDIHVPSTDEVKRTETASTQHELQQLTQSILTGG